MVNLVISNGKPVYGVNEYQVDFEKEVKQLPTDCAPGSKAYVIETKNIYTLSGYRKWEVM